MQLLLIILGKRSIPFSSKFIYYIRCIKPNETKTPVMEKFEGGMVLKQLNYSGVLEAVEIRQTGYPFRMTHR
jgi:myosin heavy subunit